MPDTGLTHDAEDLRGLRTRAGQRLGADDPLAGRGGDAHGFDVHLVGQGDHHEVDLRVRAQRRHVVVPARDRPPLLGERLGTGQVSRVGGDQLGSADVLEGVRVGVGVETGTEKTDSNHISSL